EQQADALRGRALDLARPIVPEIPASLRGELRHYQREGFEFLTFLSANRLGGVLADDMGLGKTLQALTWLLWLASRQPPAKPLRTLVVCPKSVVGNWESETARFAPALKVTRFAPDGIDDALAAAKGDPLIVVANYTQLRLNEKFFKAQAWDAVILDEAQFIKNPSSKVAHIARDLRGEHRLVLTGTPIENRLLDLWSLFAFALPGLLGSQAAFKRHYSQDNPLALARLRARVRHFLLRRTKAQVASELPPRTEEDVVVELEGDQEKLYQAELKRARAQLLRVATPQQLDKARFNILASLMRLRQICCHPALVDPTLHATPSAKLDELMERVEELRDEGHQVLVFSQFVEMLHLIRDRMTAAGIEHLLLTGQTENRDELIARFQTDRTRTVFLLSLKAAGFGLNLTAASYVILYDPWWNPAVEAQAIDRTHRIGQVSPVNAYRLIARGTVEEKIRALQKEKAALASAVVQEESLASVLDLETLKQVLA
ncbi:MAG: DEAD/DEAH box helicase, partial [Opitutaceae bacterium]